VSRPWTARWRSRSWPGKQWRGEAADARTDLYAFGCTLHELLTGPLPFPGATSEALRYQHLNAPPRRLDALRPGMPTGLSDLLEGLLAKDPVGRPASAARVSAALAAPWTAQSARETQTAPPKAQALRAAPRESSPGDSTTVAATSQELARRAAEEGFTPAPFTRIRTTSPARKAILARDRSRRARGVISDVRYSP
jgi:serine/threonine protein kinase